MRCNLEDSSRRLRAYPVTELHMRESVLWTNGDRPFGQSRDNGVVGVGWSNHPPFAVHTKAVILR